jgi:predicted RNA binding protein YcfA (HicA-like mRNA interferase family)
MNSRLTLVSWNELVRGLREFGFQGPYRGGKHYFMVGEKLRLTIPNPHRQDISVSLLREILNRPGIDRDEWISGRRSPES